MLSSGCSRLQATSREYANPAGKPYSKAPALETLQSGPPFCKTRASRASRKFQIRQRQLRKRAATIRRKTRHAEAPVMRVITSLITVLLTTATATSGVAQEKPNAIASAEHKALDALTGTWDVAITFKVGPGKTAEGKATCVTKWILDNHIIYQEYSSMMNGKPFTVMQWLGYDELKQKFFEIKMDSMDSGAMHNEGSLSADCKTITQTGERMNPETKKAEKIRTVLTFEDKDRYTLEWFLPDENGKEEKAVILKHTRKKS